MTARPALVVVLIAVGGAAALFYADASLPPSRYGPAALGAACVFVVTLVMLRELKPRDSILLAIGASALGFLGGAAASSGAYPWPIGFAASWLPPLVFFVGGIGQERLSFELERLENEADKPERRPHVLTRTRQILEDARAAARAMDPKATTQPTHTGDPRGIYAYAAQVASFSLALDERYAEAVASLSEVPPIWMPMPMRALMLSNLSHWQLCTGDVQAAKRTLKDVKDDAAPLPVRPYLRGAMAAVLVRTGEFEAALDLIGHADGQQGEPPTVRQRYRITRAHALAAKGDADAARAELRRVIRDGGEDELRRWLPAGGAALPAMRELLEES